MAYRSAEEESDTDLNERFEDLPTRQEVAAYAVWWILKERECKQIMYKGARLLFNLGFTHDEPEGPSNDRAAQQFRSAQNRMLKKIETAESTSRAE